MSDESTVRKRTYFRETTAQQRRLLFETYERTGDVQAACRAARVSVGTFYYWRARFAAGGYPALESPGSHAAHHHANAIPPAVATRVLELKAAHPTWGRVRIAQELAKGNQWVPLLSPTSVQRTLQRAGVLPAQPPEGKKGGLPSGTPKRRAKR